jgi:AraC family transcriptional regulator
MMEMTFPRSGSGKVNLQLAAGNFYGKTLKQHQVGGFSLSETRYLPRSTLPRHSHESHYVCLVLSGTYKESYERKTRSCQPSMIVSHPAGEQHAQYFDDTAVELFRIGVNPARLRDSSYTDLYLESRDFRGGLPIVLAQKLYQEFREPDAVSYLAVEGLALELIAAIARGSHTRENTSRRPRHWLSQAHELVKSRFLEHLTLGDIAHTVGVHQVTLAREFRRTYDCTIGEMVRYERIGFACRELVERQESLADVAIAAGFYDQSHFSKTFKKVTGKTPSEYRISYRPTNSVPKD